MFGTKEGIVEELLVVINNQLRIINRELSNNVMPELSGGKKKAVDRAYAALANASNATIRLIQISRKIHETLEEEDKKLRKVLKLE